MTTSTIITTMAEEDVELRSVKAQEEEAGDEGLSEGVGVTLHVHKLKQQHTFNQQSIHLSHIIII